MVVPFAAGIAITGAEAVPVFCTGAVTLTLVIEPAEGVVEHEGLDAALVVEFDLARLDADFLEERFGEWGLALAGKAREDLSQALDELARSELEMTGPNDVVAFQQGQNSQTNP